MPGEHVDIEQFLIPGTTPDVVEHYRGFADAAEEMSFELIEDEVIVVDTETTGTNPAYDKLIEIAAVRLRGTTICGEFQTFVNPGRRIPEEITELTGITNEDVAGAPDSGTAVDMFADFAAGSDLVAHNASFDRAFIMREAVPGAIGGQWMDTLALSHIALPRFKTHRLADLARAFSTVQSSHRALDDVRALAQVWRVLLVALQGMPTGLAQRIALIAPEVSWPLRGLFQTAARACPGADFSLRRFRRERSRIELETAKFDAEEVPLSFPEESEIRAAFSKDGYVGSMYEGYEQRTEQVDMALAVGDVLREGGITVLEAGTGVGKSMAYLLPLALSAKKNAITCGVATKTNALMDQLVYRELPRLARSLGGLNYMALKGYEHYPCLRKVESLADQDELSVEAIESVATLLAYTCQTGWGDLDALNVHWHPAIRSSIEASPNDCLKNRCPYFPRSCYLHGARRNANSADIVVTNHALLFRDAAMDNGILPPVRHWVVDEAHGAEAEARKQLSSRIAARDLEFTLNRMTGSRTGVIARVRAKAPTVDGGDMLYGVTADIDNRIEQVRAIATSFFSFVKDLESEAPHGSGGYDRVTLWVGPELRASGAWAALESPGRSLADKLSGLTKRMNDLAGMLEQFEGTFATQQADLSNAICNLESMAAALVLVLDGTDESYVYSAELDRNPDKTREVLNAEKLDVGAELGTSFYPNVRSVAFTSATLSTGSAKGPFAHFTHVMGLDFGAHGMQGLQGAGEQPESQGARAQQAKRTAQGADSGAAAAPASSPAPKRVRTLQMDSSYDFDSQMTVYLPEDIPEPASPMYAQALVALLYEVHVAMEGSTLTLFTNRREMEAAYKTLKPRLAERGLGLAAQARGISTKNLRDRFLEDESLSLFALRSFWEGFDAPGDTLRCVVIPKLPFGRPTDPIACERKLRESGSAWRRYQLPEAVMDLKQAAGRLIRTSTDSGYLVLADARLQTKSYGKTFLQAMPTRDIRVLATEQIAAEIVERHRMTRS